MNLFETLTTQINEAQKIVKKGDYVALEIMNQSDRYFIRNPQLIQEEDGIYVTNGNGGFYNLKYCIEIFVRIMLPNRSVSVNQYKKINR